jgi:hypothetical protein
MVGAFGLLDGWHDELIPLDRLVETHPAADVHAFARKGLLVVGTEATIEAGDGHGGYHLAVREAGKVELDGQTICVGWHPALPLHCWICPRCQCDRYKLSRVDGAWACRKCHRLDFACRHRDRTIPKLNRIRSLRRRLGADPTLFSPLPRKRLHAKRHWRLCREIRQLEQALIEHGRRDVAEVLERRHARARRRS